MDDRPELVDAAGVGDPWRCSSCRYLMYNLQFIDGRFAPVAGAPHSKFLSKEFPRVCNVCFDMHTIVSTSNYFRNIETHEREEYKKTRRLFPGEDYLNNA